MMETMTLDCRSHQSVGHKRKKGEHNEPGILRSLIPQVC